MNIGTGQIRGAFIVYGEKCPFISLVDVAFNFQNNPWTTKQSPYFPLSTMQLISSWYIGKRNIKINGYQSMLCSKGNIGVQPPYEWSCQSNQILSNHSLLRKCICWQKTMFFHLIDIATPNSFTLFHELQKQEPSIIAL